MLVEDREGANPFNPWGKINTQIVETSLEEISADPESFIGQHVEFVCRFHKSEKKFHSFYTGIGENQYEGFSVWGMKNVLFKEGSFARDNPFMYVEKRSRAKTALAKLKKFEVIKVVGEVKSSYLEKPWIVIENVETQLFSVRLNEKALGQARLGLSLIEDEQFVAAAKELQATLEHDFDTYMEAQVSKYCGYSFLMAGQYEEAIPYLDDAFSSIEDAETGGWWGEALVRAGKTKEAISTMENVVEQFPSHLGLRLSIAEAYSVEGNVDLCLRHARAALNLQPGNKKSYVFMGKVLVDSKNDEAALKIYREAESKAVGDTGNFNWSIGHIYYRCKQYQHSFNEFEVAKRSYPDSDSLCLDIARSYREAGKKFHVKAARNFNRAFEINENLVAPRLELGSMHYDDQEYIAAITALDAYLLKAKDHVPALIMKGVSHEKLGQFEKASKTFAHLENLNGKGYASHHLGFNLLALKKYESSAEAYTRAAWAKSAEDFRFDAALHAGSLYLMLDKYNKALPVCELAYSLKPKNVATAINAALANEGMGKHERAFEVLSESKDIYTANASQSIIMMQHWSYNALVLGHTMELEDLALSIKEVHKARPKNEKALLCYGWALARSDDDTCLAVLQPLIKNNLEARVASIEFYLGRDRLDDAQLIAKNISLPSASESVVKSYRVLLERLQDELKNREERLEKEAKVAKKRQNN